MKTLCNLPDSITLPTGETLKAVIGGHLEQKPFLTVEGAGVDCTRPNWGTELLKSHPDFYEDGEVKAIIREAKRRKLKYRRIGVLSRGLRGRLDLHGANYRPTKWVFVEVRDPEKQPCPRSPSGQHEGYWIQYGASFRCYHCGCQYHLREMNNPPPLENIEAWRAA